MTFDGATVVVIGAGYAGKRPMYERIAQLGARIVIVDEAGHWSQQLVDEGLAGRFIPTPATGDPDVDAVAALDALSAAAVEPDGVLTFWERSERVGG